jgi:uncharacterized protein (DUF1800 family)
VAASDSDAALIAFNRFGLGAKPGDFTKPGLDPRGLLLSELAATDIALISQEDSSNRELLGATPAIQASMAAAAERKLERDRAAASNVTPVAMSPETAQAAAQDKPKPAQRSVEQKLFRLEAQARFSKAINVKVGFVERLVAFWSNHFCVSVAKNNIVRVASGPFEREAIRPFVLGRFSDMLLAVERHPAMLFYLDNEQSIGPDSRAGKNRKRGLNENLAREILELHTLGVGSGYSQTDVTSFANILTGWTMAGREGRLGEPGAFVFNASAHEPGDEIFMGKTYSGGGMGQAEAVLNEVARHPATVNHIASKLARHFIADDPPPAVVAKLAKVFTDKDGDLRALAATLVDTPEAWSQPLTKMRSPLDYTLAIRRAIGPGPDADPGQTLGWLNMLGEPLWQPPGPNGFPDTADAHASPAGMRMRLDIAWQAARQIKEIGAPSDILEAVLGSSASPETRQSIGRAESRQEAVALLLMSPEFQRR